MKHGRTKRRPRQFTGGYLTRLIRQQTPEVVRLVFGDILDDEQIHAIQHRRACLEGIMPEIQYVEHRGANGELLN